MKQKTFVELQHDWIIKLKKEKGGHPLILEVNSVDKPFFLTTTQLYTHTLLQMREELKGIGTQQQWQTTTTKNCNTKYTLPNQKIFNETTFRRNNKRNNCVNPKCNYQNIYRFYLYTVQWQIDILLLLRPYMYD